MAPVCPQVPRLPGTTDMSFGLLLLRLMQCLVF